MPTNQIIPKKDPHIKNSSNSMDNTTMIIIDTCTPLMKGLCEKNFEDRKTNLDLTKICTIFNEDQEHYISCKNFLFSK